MTALGTTPATQNAVETLFFLNRYEVLLYRVFHLTVSLGIFLPHLKFTFKFRYISSFPSAMESSIGFPGLEDCTTDENLAQPLSDGFRLSPRCGNAMIIPARVLFLYHRDKQIALRPSFFGSVRIHCFAIYFIIPAINPPDTQICTSLWIR